MSVAIRCACGRDVTLSGGEYGHAICLCGRDYRNEDPLGGSPLGGVLQKFIDLPTLLARCDRLELEVTHQRDALQRICHHPVSIDTLPSFCGVCGKERP